MMVLLEGCAPLALNDKDGCVDNFVEFGEVEPPAPESQSLIPDAAKIRLIGQAGSIYVDVRVQA